MSEENTEIPAVTDEANDAIVNEKEDSGARDDTASADIKNEEKSEEKTEEILEETTVQSSEDLQTAKDPPDGETTNPDAGDVSDNVQSGEGGGDAPRDMQEGSEKVVDPTVEVNEQQNEEIDGIVKEGMEDVEENESNEKQAADVDADALNTQDQETAEDVEPLPENSTFADGERPETPVVAVIDPLSREGSPTQEPQSIQPATPERIESPMIEYDEYEDEGPVISREELIELYQAALVQREQLQNTNTQFQHKLAEYFKKKKTDDQRQEMDKNVTDQEQRYLKYMSNLEELRKQEDEERKSLQEQEEELSNRKGEKLYLVECETNEFAEFKKATALNAINSRTGKPILPKDVEHYLLNEVRKEDEVKQVRLDNIKLKNRLKKREQQLKAKEELAEGLHLIDFEQLKIENQTYNEKIEERNEELLKLRKKITSTVQVLTHVKEKLQFVQAENHVQKAKLRDVEEFVAKKRDILSRTKKARDKLRIDNQRQMQKCGLLGNKPLLRDFEDRKDEGNDLRARLEFLKQQHAELTLDSNGLKKKIEEAKSVRN